MSTLGIVLIFFFKINVNLPQLLYFVVLAAVSGECWQIEGLTESNKRKTREELQRQADFHPEY